MIAYMTHCIVACPKKTNGQHSKKFIEKIVKLHVDRLQTMLLDTDEKDRMDSEEPTLYHVLKMQKYTQQERSKRCRTPLAKYTRPPQGIIQIFA